jgi:hypothetical protein
MLPGGNGEGWIDSIQPSVVSQGTCERTRGVNSGSMG